MASLKKFSYGNCVEEMNRQISPQKSALPAANGKEDALVNINEFIIETYRLPVLYRYTPVNVYELSNIANGTVYLSLAKDMNDVSEGAFYVRDTLENVEDCIDQMQGNILLKSFSYSKNNILLWSHYADSHKGICIGYDFSKLQDDSIKRKLYPV